MLYNPWSKKGGKNHLEDTEIQLIRDTYKKLNSIEKTAKECGYCKNTINKYVKDLSVLDNRSRDNNRAILKLSIETGKKIRRFKNANQAANLCHISASNLNQCLNHRTNSAGGFCWCYEDEFKDFKIPTKTNKWHHREIDLILGIC